MNRLTTEGKIEGFIGKSFENVGCHQKIFVPLQVLLLKLLRLQNFQRY